MEGMKEIQVANHGYHDSFSSQGKFLVEKR